MSLGMANSFDFWFDFSCPYAYLASTQVEALAERTGATMRVRPMLLGGVFRAVEQPQNLAATLAPVKARHMRNDLRRFAAYWGVPLTFPAGHPIRTVTALRSLLVVGEPYMPLVHAFYRAYWVDGIDLASDEGVASVLTREGHDAAEVLAAAQKPEVKDALRALTDEATELGIFGAPACVVDDIVYWGQDRLKDVERALGGAPLRVEPDGDAAMVDFWFDFSSPFAAIGNALVRDRLGDDVQYRPMLLGAVFKAVGTDNVPLFTFSGSKRAWAAADMQRQAEAAGLPLRWPSRFPMRTVLPLRVLLQIGPNTPAGRDFTDAVFRGYWCEDRDISEPSVVTAIADDLGLDGVALVQAAGTDAGKAALKETTGEAIAKGVFGAPTFTLEQPGGDTSLYWGGDRMDLVVAAAHGDASVY